MNWSTDLPREIGVYFYRQLPNVEPADTTEQLCVVSRRDGEFVVQRHKEYAIPLKWLVGKPWEWCGPLNPTAKPKERVNKKCPYCDLPFGHGGMCVWKEWEEFDISLAK